MNPKEHKAPWLGRHIFEILLLTSGFVMGATIYLASAGGF